MIIFFGPAGSGKSTQAQMIVDKLGWTWLSMGQLLRDATDSQVHDCQLKGLLVPIEKVNQLLSDALDKFNNESKILVDGYPRQVEQARWLIESCKLRNLPIDLAINFDVAMAELLKRIELRGRSDDTAESINQRIAIYHKEINPILDFFSESGIKIVNIDGVGTVEEIYDRIMKEIIKCKLV